MSVTTKILVVLVVLASMIVSAATVTFVANTNNFKAENDEMKSLNSSLKSEIATLRQHDSEKSFQMKELQKKLSETINALEDENARLTIALRNSERMSQEYQNRVNGLAGVMTSFEQTIGNMEQTLKLTQGQLNETRQVSIKERKELNEITGQLYERQVQLDTLEADRKRLLEQKVQLEDAIRCISQGQSPVIKTVTVTSEISKAKPAAVTAEPFALNGLITEISESLIALSVGSADGIREHMRLHVTRGGVFVCDVVVTNVDTNKAAGIVEMMQESPKIGDRVSTKL